MLTLRLGWTYQDIKINNCQASTRFCQWSLSKELPQVGFDLTTGGVCTSTERLKNTANFLFFFKSLAAEAIRDVSIKDTPIFLRLSEAAPDHLSSSIVVSNIHLENVPTAIGVVGGAVVLTGTTDPSTAMTLESWAQGNVYAGSSSTYSQGSLPAVALPSVLLDNQGMVVHKTHPQVGAIRRHSLQLCMAHLIY
jgi:hypothetical protein